MDTVCPAPVKVTVDFPFENPEPAPLVFQLPETAHDPFVRVNVPLVPPIIVNPETDAAEPFAASTPALPTTMAPPVSPRLLVASVVAPPPPWTVRIPDQASAFVPLARVPPERVSSPDVVSWLWRVRVPPLTVSAPKEALPPTRRFPVPENVTVELVAVKVVAEDVSQFPELIVIVADANVKVAAPLEVRLFVPNATLPAFVKASVPVHVRDPVNVVETAGVTVRLLTVCVTLMEPPDAFTTTVEAPTVNVPRWVSIEVTVMMDPLAVRAPPAFTTSVAGLIARFEPLVFSVVVPAPPAIVSVPPTSRLFAAIVNVTVEAPELNVTFPANSRVGLPNVIVREAEELKVIGATKLHEADVEEFVHDPDAVQEPPAVDVM